MFPWLKMPSWGGAKLVVSKKKFFNNIYIVDK